jgi:O-antigen/teichoic acid export membrane protein
MWNGLFTVWSMGVTILLTPFMLRRLGSDHYGLYILLMSVTGMMGLMNLGLGDAVLRFVAYHHGRNSMEGINRVVGSTFFVSILTGLTAGTVLFLASPSIVRWLSVPQSEYPLGEALLRLTSVSLAATLIGGSFSLIAQALQRYDVGTKVLIAQSIISIASIVILLLLGFGLYEVVLSNVIISCLNVSMGIVVAKRLLPSLRVWPRCSRQGLKEIFGYGVFTLVGQAFWQVYLQAGRLLLGAFVNTSAVAYLNVPQQLSQRGVIAVQGAGAALLPRFSAMQDHAQVSKLFLDSTWTLLCMTAVLFVPLTVLTPDLLRLWISPDFASHSAWIGQIIAFTCILRGASVPFGQLFLGLGKPWLNVISLAGMSLTTLGLNLVLIPAFGLAGAGYCQLVVILWDAIAIIYAWKFVLRMPSIRPLGRAVALPSLVAMGTLCLQGVIRASLASVGWVGLAVLGLTFVATTAALLTGVEHLAGRNQSRVHLLWQTFRRVLPRRQV